METTTKKASVHEILARSYSVYFVAVIVGMLASSYFGYQIVPDTMGEPIGILFLVLGGLLVLWSQFTSNRFKGKMAQSLKVSDFECGPYRFSRQPTNIGLTLLVFGFAFLINSLAVFVFACAAFITSRRYIIKQEKLLEEKYGNLYVCYKREVKRWF